MSKGVFILLSSATLLFSCGRAFADDPNGPRPGLLQPPTPSLNSPVLVSVPEGGSSVLLLGAALLFIASTKALRRR